MTDAPEVTWVHACASCNYAYPDMPDADEPCPRCGSLERVATPIVQLEPDPPGRRPQEAAISEVIDELINQAGRPPIASPREGYAIILEHTDDLWAYIRSGRGNTPASRADACQVAAAAIRYMLEMTDTPA